MAIIKQLPEDFIVEELQPAKLKLSPGNCNYKYFWLTKKGLSTLEAIRAISDYLGISKDRIGFAGAKDKKAVTTQLISIRKGKEALPTITLLGACTGLPP